MSCMTGIIPVLVVNNAPVQSSLEMMSAVDDGTVRIKLNADYINQLQ